MYGLAHASPGTTWDDNNVQKQQFVDTGEQQGYLKSANVAKVERTLYRDLSQRKQRSDLAQEGNLPAIQEKIDS